MSDLLWSSSSIESVDGVAPAAVASELRRLASLRDRGALSDAELALFRERVLGAAPPATSAPAAGARGREPAQRKKARVATPPPPPTCDTNLGSADNDFPMNESMIDQQLESTAPAGGAHLQRPRQKKSVFGGLESVDKAAGLIPPALSPASKCRRRRRRSSLGDDAPIDAADVLMYHKIVKQLAHIKSTESAATTGSAIGHWNWKTKETVPGRIWHKNVPDDIREKVSRSFTPDEVDRVLDDARVHTAPKASEGEKPRVLYILGPAGAGKSTAMTAVQGIFRIKVEDYVAIEGDDMRDQHTSWNEVLADRAIGYSDAMKVLNPAVEEMRKILVDRAMAQRQNMMISTTGQNPEKLKDDIKSKIAAGYAIDVVGLVTSMRRAGCRAINRAHINGRWHEPSMVKWEKIMQSIMWTSDPSSGTDKCVVLDNEEISNPIILYSRIHTRRDIEGVIQKYRKEDEHCTPPKLRIFDDEGGDGRELQNLSGSIDSRFFSMSLRGTEEFEQSERREELQSERRDSKELQRHGSSHSIESDTHLVGPRQKSARGSGEFAFKPDNQTAGSGSSWRMTAAGERVTLTDLE